MSDSIIKEISLDGFQVVSGQMFCHMPRMSVPTLTITPKNLSFNKAAVEALNCCEHIRIEVNDKKRGILIVPVTVKDRDGIRWLKNGKTVRGKSVDCTRFANPLYGIWGWESDSRFRSTGKLVSSDGKVMLLFDFSQPETWAGRKAGAPNG